MRRVEIALLCAVCAASAFAQTNAAQSYNRADTFEPGKKYTCVPTADHKGWDCNEAGKAVQIKPKDNDAPPPVTAPESARAAAPAESTPPPAPSPTATFFAIDAAELSDQRRREQSSTRRRTAEHRFCRRRARKRTCACAEADRNGAAET